MADGNVGNLWISFGLQDEVTNALKRLKKEFNGTDEKAKQVSVSIREISAALKKPLDLKAVNGALANLTALLEKSKTDTKDLAVALKAINTKDVLSLFEGKITASNANSYLETIKRIKDAINGLGRIQGLDTERLFGNLDKVSAHLATIIQIKDNIKNITDFGSNANIQGSGIEQIVQNYKKLRTEMIAAMNDGSWGKGAKWEELHKKYAQIQEQTISVMQATVNRIVAAQTGIYNRSIDQMVGTAEKGLNGIDKGAKDASESVKNLESNLKNINEILNAFRGAGISRFMIPEAGENMRHYVDILNLLNKAQNDLLNKKSDDKDEQAKVKQLQQKIENALQYLKLLQRIDIAEATLNEKKQANPNVDPNKFKEAERLIANFRKQLVGLESETFKTGVDNAHVLGNYATTWTMTMKQIDGILGKFQKPNPLSDLDNNFSKIDAKIDAFREKLAKLRDLMSEGTSKGFNTSMLTDRIAGMSGIVAQMEKALNNEGKVLSDANRMKQLFSDMQVELSKTTTAFQTYGREKANAIAKRRAEDAEEARNTQIVEDMVQRRIQVRQREVERMQEAERQKAEVLRRSAEEAQRAFNQEIKGNRVYWQQFTSQLQTQMTSRLRAEDADRKGPDLKSDRGLKNISNEIDNLRAKLEEAKKKVAYFQKSTTSENPSVRNYGEIGLKKYTAEVERLTSSISNLQQVYNTLSRSHSQGFVERSFGEMRSSDTLRQMSKYYRDEEKRAAKEAATQKREISVAEKRYNSLENYLYKLREETDKSLKLNVDTSAAEWKILELKDKLAYVTNIMNRLKNGDTSAIGQLGSVGTGRDLTLAGRTLAEQKALNNEQEKLNRKKERAIEQERKHQQEVARTAAKVRTDLAKAFEQAKKSASGVSQTMQDIKSLFMQGGIVYGAQQFVMSVIQMGGELEKQHIAMQSILGDLQNANEMFAQTKELALNSPFTFSELNKDVKQLAAYGVEYDQLYDTTKRLADMASGLGVSFERIALAFGQVRSRGWLDGKELRQISYAGIPLLSKLSEYYSKREGRKVTTSEVKTRISGRGVDFEDVKNVFWEMTDAGGQFYNMQQVLSDTLLGKYNKLKDAWEIMLSEFASGNNIVGGGLKKILELVTWLTQNLHALAPVVAASFAGPLLRRMNSGLGGGLGQALLSAKQGLANEYTRKALSGKELNGVEQNLLRTKRQITVEDIKALSKANALTRTELKRLYVTGQITKEMYKQGMAFTEQNVKSNTLSFSGFFKGWNKEKFKAAGGLIAGGLKSGFSSVLSFFGGLPGIAITAGTAIGAYFYQRSEEIKQTMKQTMDELQDRGKQMDDFFNEHNASKAIASGDTKEIGNMIDLYKEKIREISPESADLFEMKADERASHEERLEYLAEQLKLLREANELAQKKVKRLENGDDPNFTSSQYLGRHENALENAKKMIEAADEGHSFEEEKEDFEKYVGKLKRFYQIEFPNLINNPKQQEAYKAMLNNRLADLGATEKEAKVIRSALDRALGLRDTTMEKDLAQKLISTVDKAFPEIANRIRSHKELDEESKKKVQNLMRSATAELGLEYQYFESELKSLLAASNFEAVINLTYQTSKPMEDMESLVYDNIMGKASVNTIEGQSKNALFDTIKPLLKGVTNIYDARNAVKTKLDALYNQMISADDLAKKKPSEEAKKQAVAIRKEYTNLKDAAYEGLGYTYIPEDKKSNKIHSQKEDKELKNLRERINLYKKLYQNIRAAELLYGKEGALPKLKSDGEFKSIFNDKKGFPITNPRDYEASIKAILKTVPSTTEDRKQFKKSELADIQTENRKIEEDAIKDVNTELERQVSLLAEKYEIYEKMYKLTGDREGAMSIAFGSTMMQSDTMLEYLKGEVEKYLPEANERSKSNLTIDDVLYMNESELNKIFGKDSKNISVLVKRLKAEQDKVEKKVIDEISEIISKNATLEQQIEDENRDYESKKKKINESNASAEMKDRALKGLDKSHNEKSASLRFEKFKKDNDWVTIFDDLNRVSTKTIDSMITKIDDFSKDGTLSVEVVKNLREALSKLRTEVIDRSPYEAILGGVARGNAIGDYLKTATPNANGKYVLSEEQAKKTGLQSNKEYSKTELENAQRGSYDDSNKAIGSLTQKFKALQDCLSPVIDLFKSLGMEDTPVGEGANILSNSLGAASQVSGGLNALGLKDAGPYGAAAAAALSVLSGLFSLHDKALQKDIEASERRQKEMENMVKNVKSVIDSTLGGLYNYKMDTFVQSTIRKIQKNDKNQYSFATREAANKAMQDPTNAYQAQKASLLAQRDEIRRQYRDEDLKKNSNKDKLKDYEQQYRELTQQIKQVATDFLKDMYSIDMKSWASELTDAIVNAWSKGEDAIDAYRKKAKDLVKDLTKTIISQKVMEAALQKPLDNMIKKIEEKGKLDETDVMQTANDLFSAGENSVYNITKLLDALKAKGYDFSETGDGSVSSSIKNITEETADVLASYLNAIRLDVSVNRKNVKDLADLMKVQIPEMGQIQKAQLGQLTQLVVLAESRNDKLDKMISWMSSVTTSGQKKVYIN